MIFELSENAVERVGRFWTFCIFPKGARVQTSRKKGGAGGSILDFLRFFVRNASLLNVELSGKEGRRAGRSSTFCIFQKEREFLDIRTSRKRGAAGGSILDFLRISNRNASFLIFELSGEEVERVGRFLTFCIFSKETRVQTFGRRGGVGGLILDFLRVHKRNASLLIFELSEKERGGGSISDFLRISKRNASSNFQEKRGGGWVDFGLSAYF